MKALEVGEEAEIIISRIKQKRTEKEEIEGRIATEELVNTVIDENDIKSFFMSIRESGVDDDECRKALVNILVNEIVLYDDKFTTRYNIRCTTC